MKKADIIALLAVVLSASALFCLALLTKNTGTTVTVSKDNKIVYSGKLSRSKTVELDGNTVIIRNNSAYMAAADCKNQICVHHKKIEKSGESVICLPNRVVIEIE